jgi:signal peptidase II
MISAAAAPTWWRMASSAPVRLYGYSVALAVFVLDQIVKYWIINIVRLEQLGWREAFPFLTLVWVENRGVSLGMLVADSSVERWLLVALTAGIAGAVALWLWREASRWDVTALALVLGGAIGNIVDRIRFGYVVDFVHVAYSWFDFKYVFNVADAAITVGVILLLMRALFVRGGEKESN